MGPLRKLRGRSLRELLVRSRQMASLMGERLPWASPLPPAGVVSLRRTASAAPLPFPVLEGRGADVARLARARWPEHARAIVERADDAAAGRFHLLGHASLSFGDPIDWQLDPIAGLRAPLVHWSRVPYLDASVVGDHKVVWELNRHQHFVTLGQAYQLTGEERYAAAFAAQLQAWMDANPPKLGINWASSLEVAFRAMSWLWALHLCRGAASVPAPLVSRAERLLVVHARHLERYLSTYFSPNTHLTGEALGLLYLGTLLGDSAEARRWRATGWSTMRDELARQIRPDGVYFEQASWYHRYTIDFYLHALRLVEGTELAADTGGRRRVAEAMERASDHLLHLVRPDGSTPIIGDDDGGSLIPLDFPASDDFRGTLALAAVTFGRADYRAVAGDAPASLGWLLGHAGVEAYDALPVRLPVELSRGFPDGGVYVMRDGWDERASQLVLDAGPHGALSGGHSHGDALAIDLTVRGAPMLVDPGTFSYVGAERDAFRATSAHNTLCLDGRSSSEPGTAFRWEHWATTTVETWLPTPRFDFFEGSHDGYARLASPAVHRRSVLALPRHGWIVVDIVRSDGPHRLSLGFHAAPEVRVQRRDGASAVLSHARGVTLGLAVAGENGSLAAAQGWVSRAYGARVAADVLTYDADMADDAAVLTWLAPLAPGEEPPTVTRAALGVAWAWTVSFRDGRAELIVDNESRGPVVMGDVRTDVRFLWLRRGTDGRPAELVAIGEGGLQVDGEDVACGGPSGWTAGTWRDGHFVRES
jgi:hypothetical protein